MIRRRRLTIKRVAYDVMEAAYRKASSNGRLPATARQIYYAARPEILKRLDLDTIESTYFTQTLLTGYIYEYGPGWNVVAKINPPQPHPHAPLPTPHNCDRGEEVRRTSSGVRSAAAARRGHNHCSAVDEYEQTRLI
jgi:hypothetical protein